MEKSLDDEPVVFYGTLEDYFELEAASPLRHEYHGAGRIVAMAGGSADHARISTNVSGEMRSRLAGRPCEAFNESMRVKVAVSGKYYFPDASAVCGGARIEKDAKGLQSLANAQVIVEVISPSTDRADRGTKFDDYFQIDALREYVMVEQDEVRATIIRRDADGSRRIDTVRGLDGALKLESLNIEIPMKDIYRNVEFPPAKNPVEANAVEQAQEKK